MTRLKLRITAAAERSVRSGHPWLFSDSILEQNREGQPGELAIVYDKKDKFLAAGLFDPDSPIRARILHVGRPTNIDDAWWSSRLESAIARRKSLFDDQTTGFRWINGESDGWPGLVLDRYGGTLVLKVYTAAWLPRLQEISGLIREGIGRAPKLGSVERIILRLSRNIQSTASRRWHRSDGEILHGPPLDEPIVFSETGLQFEADVLRGQKTGFFFDQRENRRKVGALAKGRSVLNAFSFTGGFSLYAARGGAVSVADLDISTHALEGGRRNFELNRCIPEVNKCRRTEIKADAFEWLKSNETERFDLIILDPPSLAKRESERNRAIQAYARLASAGIAHLEPDGILVACSCSAHVSSEEFFDAVRGAASKSRRKFHEMETTGHAPDHPATFKEAEYLKGIYLRF